MCLEPQCNNIEITSHYTRIRAPRNIRVDEPLHIRAVVPRPHIDQPVRIGYNAIPAVEPEQDRARSGTGKQLSVGIVCKGAAGSAGDVARRVVGKALGRHNAIVAQPADRSAGHPAQRVISIACFHRADKDFFLSDPREVVIGILKAGDHNVAGGTLHGRRYSLLVVVDLLLFLRKTAAPAIKAAIQRGYTKR